MSLAGLPVCDDAEAWVVAEAREPATVDSKRLEVLMSAEVDWELAMIHQQREIRMLGQLR